MFCTALSSESITRETKGETDVLEYDSPSSSEDSEEESFANNNLETDDDVSGEIP